MLAKTVLVFVAAFFPAAARAQTTAHEPPAAAAEIDRALKLLNPAPGWSIKADQKVEFDARDWSLETLADGSEIFTFKGRAQEQKRVILRDNGQLSSISAYTLAAGAKPAREESSSVVFHKGRVHALTKCTDAGGKEGRDCLTVTPGVCEYVNGPALGFPAKLSEELKVLEVRALATILTLRGADHQLENVSRHGSRLGLKDPLQTTKGKLSGKDKSAAGKARERARDLCRAAALDGSPTSVASRGATVGAEGVKKTSPRAR